MDTYTNTLLFVISWICVGPINAGEYCTYYSSTQGRSLTTYCNGYCCTSTSDNCCSDYSLIIGLVFGGIVVFAIITAIICIVYQKKKKKSQRTIQVTRLETTVVPSGQNNRMRQRYNNNSSMLAPPPYSTVNSSTHPLYNDPLYPPPPPYPGTPAPPYQPTNEGFTGVNGATQPPRINHNAGWTQSSGLQTNQNGGSAYPPVS